MKRIESWVDRIRKMCQHPSHDPPNMIVLEPGVYEHECPACHEKQAVVIPIKATL